MCLSAQKGNSMEQNKRTVLLCNLMLLTAAFIWGCSFIFQKDASNYIGPATVMCVRYFLGSLTMLPFILYLESKKPLSERTKYTKDSTKEILKVAAILAVVKVLDLVLNQAGIGYTTASKAAFLTAANMVMVPILAYIYFRQKTHLTRWIATFIGMAGIYFMSITGGFSINKGDLLIITSTIFAATHLLLISKVIQRFDGKHFVCIEFIIASIYCGIYAFIVEKPTFQDIWACAGSLAFAGILGTGVCYALQVTAQKHTDPTVTALLLSLESVFGALAGFVVLGESFTLREFAGAFLMSAAVVLAQLKPKKTISVSAESKDN